MSSSESEEIVLISSKAANKEDSSSDIEIESVKQSTPLPGARTQRKTAQAPIKKERKPTVARKKKIENNINVKKASLDSDDVVKPDFPFNSETIRTPDKIVYPNKTVVYPEPTYVSETIRIPDKILYPNKTVIDEEPQKIVETFDNTTYVFDKNKKFKSNESAKYKIICRDGSNEKIYYLNTDDTLEIMYDDISPEAKLKYKGVFVSKFLTLEDLNYTEDENIFEVIGNTKNLINLKINLDHNKSVNIEIERDLEISEIFKKIEKQSGKENLLIINGYILDEKLLVRDVLEEEDVLDYV
ncbi:hypothetical protein NGRA_0471 [Nosema granulosis]|uniref:Ubiquitin-like domain-containing protein n=1 Tax=Nosema granulosis TaxID=83296 RepID=A0A9P6L003_9MICR|nr:hypothetical protein NGRA_0471 [Nosema granulosis]